jgi:hypothetical protein
MAEDSTLVEGWNITQHAGDEAYTVQFDEGVLSIDKFGEQYWLRVSQALDAQDLRGGTLWFGAELKLALTADGWNTALTPGGGLAASITGTYGDPFGRTRIIGEAMLEHEPHLGTVDWTPVSMRIEVPEQATELRVALLHQAIGAMSVRRPRLVRLPPACVEPAVDATG